MSTGGGEHHGCPYKHFDESHLAAQLGQMKLEREDKDAMMGMVKGKNYQLACQRHFEVRNRSVYSSHIRAHA